MKKTLAITIMMALAMNGFPQILHYDFSAVCETGQTLFYLIISEEEHTVKITYPFSEDNYPFMGNYYQGFPEPQGEIILPSTVTYNDTVYNVTTVGNKAFFNCHLTGTMTVSEGIQSFESMAFIGCRFTSIIIPRSLETFAKDAFAYCGNLESITVDDENPIYYSENNAIISRESKVLALGCKTTTIPDDIVTIGSGAFYGAGNGGDLVIPNSVTAINESAFYECQFSGTITLPDSLQYIGSGAFSSSCFSGTLTLPNSVTEIGSGAFSECRLSGDLILPSAISTIKSNTFAYSNFSGTLIIPDSVTSIGFMAFEGTKFSELVLGNSVETIDNHAFNNSNSSIHLTGVLRLPTSLTEIGLYAFAYTSFDEIHSPNTMPPTLNAHAFYECDSSIPIHIPFGCTEVYRNAEGWNYFTNFIESEMNLEGEWYYEILNDDGSITYQHLEYVADTTIGNERPKVVVRSNTQYDRDTITEVTHEYVYEENGIVYWWNKDLEEFTILYDLAANAGDEWEIKVGTESLVMHVDTVEYFDLNGLNIKMLRVSDTEGIFNGDIVCSFGHMTSFFPERLMNRNADFELNGLRCYWVGDILLYHNGDEDCDAIHSELQGLDDGPSTGSGTFAVYPNPANDILFVQTLRATSLPAETEYRITNLMGQTLLQGHISAEKQQIDISGLPAGMYFITVGDGTRKFVIR